MQLPPSGAVPVGHSNADAGLPPSALALFTLAAVVAESAVCAEGTLLRRRLPDSERFLMILSPFERTEVYALSATGVRRGRLFVVVTGCLPDPTGRSTLEPS